MNQKELEVIFSDLSNLDDFALLNNLEKITFATVIYKSLSLASGFKSAGLKIGEKFIVQLDNSPEFIYCYFAALFGGFTIIPLDSALGEKDYDYIINTSKPKLIINKFSQLNYKYHQEFFFHTKVDSTYAIFFTSGTTGKPKGVCHSIGALLGNAISFNKFVEFDSCVRLMHVMPMGYMAGFLNTVLCPFATGGTIVIAPRFNFSNVMDFWKPAIQQNANAVWLSPTMVSLITKMSRDKNDIKLANKIMKYVFVGTAPLSEQIRQQFYDKFGLECLESYGMTEALIISTNTPSEKKKSGSVGKPLPSVKIYIENLINDNSNGSKMYVKTNHMFKGYLLESQSKSVRGEWLPTGDLGFTDKDDNLFILGREKDLIIHGGTNISPVTVQDCLLEVEDIDEVVVIGSPHDFWGEEVIAFVKMLNGKKMNDQELIIHCKKRLNHDALPSKYIEVNKIPRSSTGKPQKHKLLSKL
jgi:acyl-CoA synthetase (AMP-forming)/AMP-acid ligase II